MIFNFIFLIIFTLCIIAVYHWGQRKNLFLCRFWSQNLENILKPKDKQYTWLGGVIGFRADYIAPPFKKIKIILRLIPRQSLLYLPFILLLGRKDKLQILFYLPYSIPEEIHIVRKKWFMPKIYNEKKLKKKKITFKNKTFFIFYEKTFPKLKNFFNLIQLDSFHHLALTKEKNIFYLSFQFTPKKSNAIFEVLRKTLNLPLI